MEDIEDLLVGSGGAPPGFRLPLNAVGVNPRKKHRNKPNKISQTNDPLTPLLPPKIPGTQTIYIKTFGCSHNQSDSEYMAGQLSAFGYAISDNPEEGDLWLINTCTVKSPSQSAMNTLITKCKSAKKPLVVAGCVPQGSRDLKELEGVSIVGVQQIDRVVEVVEETLKGHEVRLMNRKTLPALDLPKVRKNKFVEILPINVGCLGACTYCKTKHARGHLGSYTIDSLVERVKTVIADGVKEIWLSSEDTGAYGRDIGVNLPILLNALVAELPPDGNTMLRIGMTNPPFILEHLKEIADVLRHPCVYSFLHVPVQSGSDAILTAMNREYTVSEFRTVVDTLTELVPGMQIATDIICGFPGETDEDFAQTVNLIKEYKFPQVHISQFYPRPGTPAARMKKVPSTIVKNRSRELTSVFEAFTPYIGMEGRVERIWITEVAADGIHLVGHTKGYVQVLVIGPESMLGTSAIVKITSVGRWSVFGEVIETLTQVNLKMAPEKVCNQEKCSTRFNQFDSGACSKEPEPCSCGPNCCGGQTILEECTVSSNDSWMEDRSSKNLIGWLLRKRRNHVHKKVENGLALGLRKKQDWALGGWGIVDRALLVGILVSFFIIVAVIIHLEFRTILSK
ncbi:PREDICTED: threonylcarbamoyladenosine tRNA methylthiotransferase [Theobroma cacao]|uniref:Threonylcarbamoyladenosine tRNA methylthiotransferase n=1 Tax=Theobroma cacao TaxID=3641 RepID=A0AB32UW24_THECC|nr:PREDICTED: threonylcarbamoyladenosine tRNA methylthiotransferase [Theobroma cacao]